MHCQPCPASMHCQPCPDSSWLLRECRWARRVNWKPAKASALVKSGDVISCAGKGRCEVGEISETKKGRFAIELVRYL